jgi:hypothetical protein
MKLTWFTLRNIRILIGISASAVVLPLPVAAEALVDVQLVIAADVSISMDRQEKQLQQEGFARAFRHPEIVRAIQAGPLGRIAVVYFEWGGERQQRVVIPWMLIDGAASARRFAEDLEDRSPSKFIRGTSLSGALEKAAELFANSKFSGGKRVVNISGDGMNTQGREIEPVRRALVDLGITINGMPIVYKGLLDGVVRDREIPHDPQQLIDYFEQHVIGGSEAFVEPVVAMRNYEDAIHRKLLREIGLPIYSDLNSTSEEAALEVAASTVEP